MFAEQFLDFQIAVTLSRQLSWSHVLALLPLETTEEVKNAYRKLSLKFHPDKNDGDLFFTERFKEIKEAYEIFIDNKKGYYDEKNKQDISS